MTVITMLRDGGGAIDSRVLVAIGMTLLLLCFESAGDVMTVVIALLWWERYYGTTVDVLTSVTAVTMLAVF